MKKQKILRLISILFTVLMLSGIVSQGMASADTPQRGIKVGGTLYDDVQAGDIVQYTIKLKAEEKFEGIQADVKYDSTRLTLIDKGEKETLSAFKGITSYNTKKADFVKFSATNTSRYNFQTEKTMLTLEFVVKDTSYSEIGISVIDMLIKGDRWYFNNSEPQITQGITITESLQIIGKAQVEPSEETTSPAPTAAVTMPIPTEETTQSQPAATNPEDNTPKKGIEVGGELYCIAEQGESVLYRVSLEAAELFENLELTIAYDSQKLQLAMLSENGAPVSDEGAVGKWMCTNLQNPIANTSVDGIIKLTDFSPAGNDFTQENMLIEIEFVVKDSAYSKISLTFNEMIIKGGEDAYFSQGVPKKTEGIEVKENLSLGKKPLPAPTQPETDATESSATQETQEVTTQVTSTTATQETTTQMPSTDSTEDKVTQPSSADATEESSTEVSTTDKAEEPSTQNTSCVTESSTATETLPASTEEKATSTPATGVVYIVGDANSDEKVNVKDATMIQKSAASLVILDLVQTFAADCDENGQVNVRDATAVQKFAAGIATGLSIGEERIK